MRNFVSSSFYRVFVVLVLLAAGLVAIHAQDKTIAREDVKGKDKGFCSDNWSSNDRESYRELREMNVAAGGVLDVDSGRNGGISVKGDNRSDILIRACVQAWGATQGDAKAAADSVKISTGSSIRADGADESNYSVSYQIFVPRNTDVRLKAHNGGISISSVDGNLQFETQNGGVNLDNVGGDVKGSTTNGGVNVNLIGNSWRGSGLEVQTSNGGVHISMPATFAANIETGTVNGGFSSDIPSLNVEKDDRGRVRNKHVVASLNGGGAPIHVSTTNGGVRISSSGGEVKY
jgi:hypothetical protein